MDTINRLLKKQEPKRRKKAADGDAADDDEEPKAPSTFVRLVRTIDGPQMMVPESWVDSPAGDFMRDDVDTPRQVPYTGRMVEEVS
jgi:Ino eighty subunit 2